MQNKQTGISSAAELVVACIGCVLMAGALAANQAWFDRHFLPSFWISREEIIQTEQRARMGVALAGAVMILFLRKPIARLLGQEPLYRFTTAIAIALAIGTAESVLRVRAANKSPELNDRLRHWDAYLGCFVDRSYTRHDTHLGRDYPLVFDPNGYRVADARSVVDFNAPTIVLTGESVIVGLKLEWPDTIAAQISKMLGLQSANIAIPGLSTDQAYLRLSRELPRFRRPVAVVSLFTPSLFDRNLEDDRPHLGPGLVWRPPVEHWRLARMIRRVIHYRSDDDVERGIARTREVLTATVRLARSRGAVPLIVVPEFGTELPRERELRERILDEGHLPYVLVTLDEDDRVDNDGHPNADGASTIAEAIKDAIGQEVKVAMKIGIIGAGMIGSTVGELWTEAGHDVQFATRHPEELQELVKRLGAHASAGTPGQAAQFGEVVMLSVPLAAIPALAADIAPLVAGKVILDTGNAYEKRDGATARDASRHPKGSAGWAAAMFPDARWVKAFNTVYFKTLASEAHRDGDRVGIPLAGDDATALDVASRLVQDAGFDPVIVGELARGKEFEPDTKPYNTGMTGPQLRQIFR